MSRSVRYYADSADLEAVNDLLTARLIRGVTTNPTILHRAGRTVQDLPELYGSWSRNGAEEIFFQSWGSSTTELVANARQILALGDRVVVKVPATSAGFPAAAILAEKGAAVLVTAVYSRAQALTSAAIGARYIAPYLGRLLDAGLDGVAEVAAMQALVAGTGTEVLAASLRTPEALVDLAAAGVSHFTAAPAVLWAAVRNDLSDASAEEFERAIR